ncbi:MAG: MalY/PatB family protein, partial [Myxococcota bacterium]|nr:MalY/PatB family protein [Myxococcota bacterium]
PLGPGAPPLRVLFVSRDAAEVAASQSALLAASGADPQTGGLAPDRLAGLLEAQRARARARLEAAPAASVLDLRHEALLRDPVGEARRIAVFLADAAPAGLDVDAMAGAVDPALHREHGYTGPVMAPTVTESVVLGPVRLEVDHRMPGPEGGPTLRVRRAADDRELLRFDAFAEGAHWHLDPAGRDEITRLEPGVEPLDRFLGWLREDLAGWLARVGVEPPPDPEEAARALDRVEAALRHPPFDPDALDPSRLRAREGEKWQLYPPDVLPLWVADMDFPPPEPVRRRLRRAVANGDLGYPLHPLPTPLPGVFAGWARRAWGLEVDPERVELLADVMQGVHVALMRFAEPGDGVVIQTPIYPPFLSAAREHGLRVVENPLRETADGYAVDLEDLRAKVDDRTRVILLSNPHNPTGRAFTREELTGIARIACERDLLIVSDEIHADLVLSGARHRPTATLGPEVAARTLTLNAASKSFNIAGLRCAVACFGSAEMRERFLSLPRHVRGGLNTLGLQASEAAWRHGRPWLERVLAHLEAQRDFVAAFVREELPGVGYRPGEATYFAWLDCRELGLDPHPYRFFLDRARVALSNGRAFGPPGEGFVRLNFATSRGILREALERMAKALAAR